MFRAVHERGSFSGAADALGVPRSTVSRAIAALEEGLGVLLFQRTTRKVAVTAEGAALFQRMAPALAALEAALVDVPEQVEQPTGTLRITATADMGAMVLAEAVARFVALHPSVQVDAHLTTRVVDLAGEGFDLGVRIARTTLPQSSLIARKVGGVAFRLYASPAYLARRGLPVRSAELAGHDWVAFRGERAMQISPAHTRVFDAVNVRVTADDMFFAREMLRRGVGIGALPSFMAEADVASGALRRVVPRWSSLTGTVHLVMPSRKHVPARVTAFRELLLEMLRQRPLAP